MHTVRMNITLPGDVAAHLNKIRNKSAFIAESIKERVRHIEEEQLSRQLEAAYRDEVTETEAAGEAETWDGASADGLEGEEDETWRDIHSQL